MEGLPTRKSNDTTGLGSSGELGFGSRNSLNTSMQHKRMLNSNASQVSVATTSVSRMPMPGSKVMGKEEYMIVDRLGQGANGVVYIVENAAKQQFCMKVCW